jgi:diguanylate cyclase (GGDEF)-like protein
VQLRTRIAVTFLALLAVVLAAALLAVSAANQTNAEREINRQLETGRLVFERALETNRRQLAQAAQVLAADFGFREAVASRDAETIVSALQNHGARIGASLAVLLSLDGRVLASTDPTIAIGDSFRQADALRRADPAERGPSVAVANGRVHQLVMVPVRSPLPVAWVVMGFALDEHAVRELASVTGLDVTLATRTLGGWSAAASTLPRAQLAAALAALARGADLEDDLALRALPLTANPDVAVTVALTHSVAEARRPFDRLTDRLVLIALASLSLTAVAAFWVARNITRPLQVLAGVVERIRGGRYDADVEIERRDEIGTLAEGLQLMRAAVESRDRDIRTLAYTDRLTGIMNRTAFAAALAEALRAGEPRTALALINVRRFRRINECLGYGVGDEVLRQIAARLDEPPRLASRVGRVAGDHFAAYTPIGSGTTPEQWGAQLLARLAAPVVVSGQPIDVSTAVGLACAPDDSGDADDLLRCADLALERARRDNADLRRYDPAWRVATPEQLSLLGELKRAIDEGELKLAFQPKIRLANGELCGAEALMRWQHPTRGLLPPGAFVPFAEQAGFIRKLTRYALREATRVGAAWHRAGRPLPIAVNISADDLADPGFEAGVGEALRESGLPPSLLALEVTESGFIADPAQALGRLEALRLLGVGLSIDDFGTGYSSLSYLTRMPVDELKIDRSFVSALGSSSEVAAVVRAALEMAHSLGLKVVAEGIEDLATAQQLAVLGCDVGQGYLYSKPLLREDFEHWRAARPVAATAPVTSLPAPRPAAARSR